MVQVQSQQQEELVDPRLPENAEIPVPVAVIHRKAQAVVEKHHARVIGHGPWMGNHTQIPQLPQHIGGNQGVHAQSGENHHIIPGNAFGIGEKGHKYGKNQTQQDAEIHDLPVPLQHHHPNKEQGKGKNQEKSLIRQNLPQIPAVVNQENSPQQAHERQHQELGLIKPHNDRGYDGIPGQQQHGKQVQAQGDIYPAVFGKWVLLHLVSSPVSFKMAAFRCSGPRGTAMPPKASATSSQAVS